MHTRDVLVFRSNTHAHTHADTHKFSFNSTTRVVTFVHFFRARSMGEIITFQIGGIGKKVGNLFLQNLEPKDVRSISIPSCGSDNCYAVAFHDSGPPVASRALGEFRRLLERCDSLQGVQFVHSLVGGTGSGVGGLLIKSVSELLNGKSILYSACLAPTKGRNNIVLESYNSALILQDLTEFCQMVFPFTNVDQIATCLNGLTLSGRIAGSLNADLRKIHSSVVPFKNAHFLVCGSAAGKSSALALAEKALDSSVIPLPPGGRYLATFLAYSGVSIGDVDHTTRTLQKSGTQFDPYFPDWIPNSISASISGGETPSLTCVTNNTKIHTLFDRIANAFDKQFAVRSHTYIYEQHGIHLEEMVCHVCVCVPMCV